MLVMIATGMIFALICGAFYLVQCRSVFFSSLLSGAVLGQAYEVFL